MAVKKCLFLLASAFLVTLSHSISLFRDRGHNLGPVEYGAHCELFIPCNSKDYTDPTICSGDMEGTCICLPDLVRDVTLNKCVSPPSGNWTFCTSPHPYYQTTCTAFAECVQEDRDFSNTCDVLKEAKRPGKVDGVCKCEDGATLNTNTGRCECSSDGTREIVEGSCKILGGKPGCTTDEACTNNASCQSGTCTCKPNFEANDNGRCVGKGIGDGDGDDKTDRPGTGGSMALVPSFIALTIATISAVANF